MSPTLFVSWRSPETRAVLPIGRIVYDATHKLYEFVYIRAVGRAGEEGFQPLLEFPRLGQRYLSDKPFPLLANRLMPAGRPEHAGFLASLGLPASAHPLEILARTGGLRATDQLSLFPVPHPDAGGCYRTHCLVQAVRYLPQSAADRIDRLVPDEKLFMMGDHQNEVDRHAIALRTADNYMVGYLPAYLAADAWTLADRCESVAVHVDRVNPRPAEVHHRLLVRVSACWPDGFRPFDDPRFLPLVGGDPAAG